MNREVLLSVPDGSLVFDGTSFVSPHRTKWVALKITNVASYHFPVKHPIRYDFINCTVHRTTNHWIVKVIGVQEGNLTDPADVLYIDDPNDGECVCGVTCEGTEIQNVPVHVVKPL